MPASEYKGQFVSLNLAVVSRKLRGTRVIHVRVSFFFLSEMSGSDQSGRKMMSNHTRKNKGDSNDNDL